MGDHLVAVGRGNIASREVSTLHLHAPFGCLGGGGGDVEGGGLQVVWWLPHPPEQVLALVFRLQEDVGQGRAAGFRVHDDDTEALRSFFSNRLGE